MEVSEKIIFRIPPLFLGGYPFRNDGFFLFYFFVLSDILYFCKINVNWSELKYSRKIKALWAK